jgi:pimeloyl-ACP methyl ester carboxylesterase
VGQDGILRPDGIRPVPAHDALVEADYQSAAAYQAAPPSRVQLLSCLLIFAISAFSQTPAMPGRLVDVGGYRVHVHCTGAGSPAVMIVGAGFSSDWTSVQPEIAKFATVCTYDPSGMAWSDKGPALDCRGRVNEVRKAMQAVELKPPYVLVGLSIGACVARLYAAEHPAEVAGMVIVDHAFTPDPDPDAGKPSGNFAGLDSPPRLLEQTPIDLTVEDISHFENLPPSARVLHGWAMSLHPKLPTAEDADDCLAHLRSAPSLGEMPLVIVSTGNEARGYARLQNQLLALSRRSSQMKAQRSFHAVEIDQPDVVIAAIRRVADAARNPTPR